MRENLSFDFGDVFGFAGNLKNSFFTGLFGIFCLFSVFLGLGNSDGKRKHKLKRLLSKTKKKFLEHFKLYFDFEKHPFHKINKHLAKNLKSQKNKQYYINEILCFLFILFFFVLAFYLGPSITGFTILTHTSSSDWTGTYNQTNSSTLTTELILDNDTSTTYFSSGDYISQVINVGNNAQWDSLNWTNTTEVGEIKFQAKSCDDASCDTETFVGPDNTSNTYFTENITLNTTLTPNNQYFQYKAYFETSNTSFTPYLESVDIGYNSFPTTPNLNLPENDTYFTTIPQLDWSNSTDDDGDNIYYYLEVYNDSDLTQIGYVNDSIAETTNTTSDTPTGLDDKTYYWHVLTTDLTVNSSWSGTRTFTIDTAPPSEFNLSSPENETLSTDDSPILTWTNSSDVNFDNYTIEISNSTDFSTINFTYASTTNSFSSWSSPLSVDTWYWRVTAYDKANNYRISTDYFNYTIQGTKEAPIAVSSTITYASGGMKRQSFSLDIIAPPTITIYSNDIITVPLIITNPSNDVIFDYINLSTFSDSIDITPELSLNIIPKLRPKEQRKIDLKLITHTQPGTYGITITANVIKPFFQDSVRIYANLIDKNLENRSTASKQLDFAKKFFDGNPICSGLLQYLTKAETALQQEKFDQALNLAQNAVQACKDLLALKEAPVKKLYTPELIIRDLLKNKNSLIIALEVIGAITILAVLSKFIKKRKRIHPHLLIPLFSLALPSGEIKHKRKFTEIRKLLLKTLAKENELTLNEIATKSKLSWKTAKLHLIYLKGKGFVIETLSTPYVRIFKVTEKGLKEKF